MKILLFRSNNLIASRCNKYVNYYTQKGLDFTAIGWDREAKGIVKDNYDFYRYKAGVNVGGIKAIQNHLHWMWFVYKYIKNHPETTTVHACDLNSAFPAAMYKRFHNKNLVVIFDACDWFSANFHGNLIIRNVFEWMERITYKYSDKLIICEPEREEQITFKISEKPIVLPNIPDIRLDLISKDTEKYIFDNNWPTIAYFGGFSFDRFLVELLELTKTEQFNLLIGGFGSVSIESLCKELNKRENVKYFGRMGMADGLAMTSCADATYAMYCKDNPNNIYAAPNKLYEAMFLGKPIISTKGTIVERKVRKYNIGYVIDEDIQELKSLIKKLDKKEMAKLGKNSTRVWEEKYKNYVSEFFNTIYDPIIK